MSGLFLAPGIRFTSLCRPLGTSEVSRRGIVGAWLSPWVAFLLWNGGNGTPGKPDRCQFVRPFLGVANGRDAAKLPVDNGFVEDILYQLIGNLGNQFGFYGGEGLGGGIIGVAGETCLEAELVFYGVGIFDFNGDG